MSADMPPLSDTTTAPIDRRVQAREALARANTARVATARLTRNLKASNITFTEALADPAAAKLAVYDLIAKQHRWGRYSTNCAIRHLRISETLQVRDLSPATRDRVVEYIEAVNARGDYRRAAA
jgi:hypothetical protein